MLLEIYEGGDSALINDFCFAGLGMDVIRVDLDGVRMARRSLLLCAVATCTLCTIKPAKGCGVLMTPTSSIKALTFDMQGTVFNFYGPLVAAATSICQDTGLTTDWVKSLPGDWSGRAHEIILDISAGRRQWIPNSDVYREALMSILATGGLRDRFSGANIDKLMGVWAEMVAWPDAAEGISALGRKFTVCTLTNASMSQMTALVKRNGLRFDEILTGELSQAYKPDPRVYQSAVKYTGFRPDELLMVSAHKWDLQASKREGFKTAYVPRPLELGTGVADRAPEQYIDIIARDLVDLSLILAGATRSASTR
ncbi:haloacid dehalogenase type II [Caballeronia sp. GAFFF1]|uniref:haloacid dehalogenase type II n=1 Tax=Caballeronia sp. GAFFF1 TaxID=2921779 RepID=UPI0020295FAA|nr:haloacid dehalogenase type II [Caballeronia sp. GAFFF1]